MLSLLTEADWVFLTTDAWTSRQNISFQDHHISVKQIFIITWPKNFVFGQVLFSSACMCLCVCVSVCLCLSVYLDYLKKFLTDFKESLQDDV